MKIIVSFLVLGVLLIASNAWIWDHWRWHDIPTVSNVNTTQYQGAWYEIARLPMWAENGCFCVQALYTLRDDGMIGVNNTCRRESVNSPLDYTTGKAWPTDSTNSKLTVQFFWPFTAPYWIFQLADDYSWALVGCPNTEYLWILSRTPTLDQSIIQNLLEFAKSYNFPIEKIEYTVQESCPGGTNFPWYNQNSIVIS